MVMSDKGSKSVSGVEMEADEGGPPESQAAPDIKRETDDWTTTLRRRETGSLRHAVSVVRRIVAERHDRPSLVSQIACEIGAEIIENIRKPGQDLNSVELARCYHTSRTPIREALMLLEKEGLVSIPPRRRPRVATFNLAEIREIYQLRAELLGLEAANVANRATSDDMALLHQALDAMRSAYEQDDRAAYLWANVEFHSCLTKVARDKTSKRIINSLLLRTLRLRRFVLGQRANLGRSVTYHTQLLVAVEDHDASLASALARSNHLQTLAALERYLATPEGRRTLSSADDSESTGVDI